MAHPDELYEDALDLESPKGVGPIYRLTRAVLLPVLGVAVGLGVWQLAAGRLIKVIYVSTPGDVWRAFTQLLSSGELAANLPITLEEAGTGFLLGAAFAIPIAISLARVPGLLRTSSPYIIAFYSVPRFALGPLFIVWFGIGSSMKTWLAASLVFFPMYFCAFDGARSVDASHVNAARLMGASRLRILWHIAMPSMLTWLFVGMRQALPYALTGAVIGEMLVATSGMGYLLSAAAGAFDTSELLAVLLVVALIGYLINAILSSIEKHVFKWKVPAVQG